MTAVVTEVRSMQWYHATEKSAPVIVLNNRNGSTSARLMRSEGLWKTQMATKIIAAANISDQRAMMLAVAPSSIAITVSVPEVAHAIAAITISA